MKFHLITIFFWITVWIIKIITSITMAAIVEKKCNKDRKKGKKAKPKIVCGYVIIIICRRRVKKTTKK